MVQDFQQGQFNEIGETITRMVDSGFGYFSPELRGREGPHKHVGLEIRTAKLSATSRPGTCGVSIGEAHIPHHVLLTRSLIERSTKGAPKLSRCRRIMHQENASAMEPFLQQDPADHGLALLHLLSRKHPKSCSSPLRKGACVLRSDKYAMSA